MSITDTDMLHQLTRVLRVIVGDHIILFCGDGNETEYEIISIDKRSIWLRGESQKTPSTESKKKITLYQALPNKYEKIEYILQKWVEIGIARFVFFRSDRSQKLLLSDAKIERFKAIAREALEQCGGTIMPEIDILPDKPSIRSQREETNIVLDTIGESIRVSAYDNLQSVALWIGPEGGWSVEEKEYMYNNGFIFARFGERVLRTETAGIVISYAFMNI